MNLRSIAAVVTGGASGLGEATVRAPSHAGSAVAIFDFNDERGAALAEQLGAVFCKVDVTSDGEVDAAFTQARATNGQERVLINCAGTGFPGRTASRSKSSGEIRHFPIEHFETLVRANLVGTFRCIAKSAAGMLAPDPLADGERGAIVNTASVAAEDGQIGQASYSASKAAIVGMTLPIARDFMDEGIRVNTILPGTFNTPLLQLLPPETRAALAAAVPFPKRAGRPQEFASLALEMCRNAYFNGASVRLGGAIRMPPR